MLLAPPAPGLARHAPCPCPCGGAWGCRLAETSCCSLWGAQGRARVSGGVSTPHSCRTPDLSAPPWGALGQVPWDHRTCMPCWLRELSFPQKGEKGIFLSPFLDCLSFGCFAQEDSPGHAEETPYRIRSRSLAASQTALTGLAGQGRALRSDLETTTPGGTVWMWGAQPSCPQGSVTSVETGVFQFGGPSWTWYFTFSPFLDIWGKMKHCSQFQRIQHFLPKMVEKT